jgi:serine/threonine protein phosphatase 1
VGVVTSRTIVIGDIHGDLKALDRLLERLPKLTSADRIVFLGDYVDRGPDSRGVVERVRQLQKSGPAEVVALRGNHEDKWIECYHNPDLGFLIPRVNGCASTFRSFTKGPSIGENDAQTARELEQMIRVKEWMPREVIEWMETLPLWYEDEHAIYVHAGLEGKKDRWKHPSHSDANTLLWMRKYEFYTGYRGKRLVFGHTAVDELPIDHLGPYARYLGGILDVWMRGDLIGLDTACGKGGHLSAVELPSSRIFDSRDTVVPVIGDETPLLPLRVAAR